MECKLGKYENTKQGENQSNGIESVSLT